MDWQTILRLFTRKTERISIDSHFWRSLQRAASERGPVQNEAIATLHMETPAPARTFTICQSACWESVGQGRLDHEALADSTLAQLRLLNVIKTYSDVRRCPASEPHSYTRVSSSSFGTRSGFPNSLGTRSILGRRRKQVALQFVEPGAGRVNWETIYAIDRNCLRSLSELGGR